MSRFKNSKKDAFIEESKKLVFEVDDPECNLASRFTINFSYLDESQKASKEIRQLKDKIAQDILSFLRDIGDRSLDALKSTDIFTDYGAFPPKNKTDFVMPKSVPLGVSWGRLRFGGAYRLAGFTIPRGLDGKVNANGYRLERNTFYVVFIDLDHKFYKSR